MKLQICLIAAAAALSACASRPPAPTGPRAQGGSWELVLPTTLMAEARDHDRPWTNRNDERLGRRDRRVTEALDRWPSDVPSLDRPRYLYVPFRGDRHLYFLDTPRYPSQYNGSGY